MTKYSFKLLIICNFDAFLLICYSNLRLLLNTESWGNVLWSILTQIYPLVLMITEDFATKITASYSKGYNLCISYYSVCWTCALGMLILGTKIPYIASTRWAQWQNGSIFHYDLSHLFQCSSRMTEEDAREEEKRKTPRWCSEPRWSTVRIRTF